MEPAAFFDNIVHPSLNFLATVTPVSSDARAHLLTMAIPGQETGWAARRQMAGGPARSYWQAEEGGALAEMFGRAAPHFKAVCAALDIPFDRKVAWDAIIWNDTLACCMARLRLWVDPAPLPEIGDADGAWEYYIRTWGPGMPRRESWNGRYSTAMMLTKRLGS
jgi:hypothetical protein